jgi:hypothetical protein
LPDFIGSVNLLGALLVSRLLLAHLIAHDTLIRTLRRLGFKCWHTLLAAMFAALILHTFQIVFFGHGNRTSLNRRAVNAMPGAPVPSRCRLCPSKSRRSAGTQIRAASSDSFYQRRIFPMRSKLAISALVVASMLGATIVLAHTHPAPGASSEDNVGPGATTIHSKMKAAKTKTSKMKSGTTTGMSSGNNKGDSARNSDSKQSTFAQFSG